MKLTLSCPHGEYTGGMRIRCRKSGTLCGHQYFKSCKGWWALTDSAGKCPLRRESHEEK